MSEPEAVKLFLSHYTIGKIPPEEAKELVRTVDLHTLTIEILAKTAQTQRTGIGILKRAITDDLNAHVYVAHRGDKDDLVVLYNEKFAKPAQALVDELTADGVLNHQAPFEHEVQWVFWEL